MPADTRSTRKAKNDDGGKQKESEEGSQNAIGSKRPVAEISSKKNEGLSPNSGTRKSVRLNSGNDQTPNPSPLRRSERAKSVPNSGKSGKSPSSTTDATQKSHKRKKTDSIGSSKKIKTPAQRYRDLFRPHATKAKASDSANGRGMVPCTSSNSGGSSKRSPVAEQNDLNEEGKCGEDYAECTSKSDQGGSSKRSPVAEENDEEGKCGHEYAECTSKTDQGGLNSATEEVASKIPIGENIMELHPGQNPRDSSVEVSVTCSERQRVDGHLAETNFQDTFENPNREIQEKEKDFSVKLSTLPSACDTDCKDFIINLHDCWSKGKNILIIDEQVQAAHIIFFILTLQSNVSRPFLVMVPSSSISKWEAEFSSVAPSVNTIVYNGNRDARKMIRALEFGDGPHELFEVLLSTVDIITEDLEYIKCIRWEAVIMDGYLKSEIFAESVFVKELASGSMILLLTDQINENVVDYRNILSLLDRKSDWCDVENCRIDSDNITLLREKLSPFIVSGPKSGSSRLVEYWVPVQMSNVQLEQYCSSILTNSTALCSKNDPIGLLPEILISTRKCCDHPYVVEEKVQGRLVQGCALENILDIGIEASGKLYFLDTILKKMKDQGQKVVILFKTLGGPGRDIIGDILDDYVRQRFGEDSYERVDGGGAPFRRQASVTKFNKEGRFIFLLETRACSSSIKLSRVDAVFIFGSDWNPLNDLKALQKIKLYSKFKIDVFRLYSMCTIEERVLLLSKKSIFPESTVHGIAFSTSHMLLTWGASYLFKNLDEFHDCADTPKILPWSSIFKDVVQEFVSLLQKHGTHKPRKFISRARQNDGVYSTDISLLGEPCSQLKDEDQHRMFWAKLLEGRQPRWRYLSLSSQRNRKRVQYYDEPSDTNVHIDETVKRKKKNGNTNVEPCPSIVSKDAEKEPVSGPLRITPQKQPELSPKSGCSTASAQKIHATVSSDKLCDEQKALYQTFKPDMENLFQILRLKEDVQQMAEQFLLYMVVNERMIREPELMQAFQISMCWIAASIRNEKLDRVESLSLAREHLNFNCTIDDAGYAFSKMQFPMKMFLRAESTKLQASSKNLVSGVVIQQKEIFAEGTLIHEGFEIESEKKKSECIKEIKKSVGKLYERQSNEEAELRKIWQESKGKLDKSFNMEARVICSIFSSEAVRTDKLKLVEANRGQKLKELQSEMDNRLNDMKARHQAEKEKEDKEGLRKMKEWKSWTENGLFEDLQAKEASEEFRTEGVPAKSSSLSENNLDEENDKVHLSDAEPVPLLRFAELGASPVDRERVNITENGAISKSSIAIQIKNEARQFENVGDITSDQLGVQGIQADEVEQIAISKNNLLSKENPTVNLSSEADANEERTAARTEQNEEASSSTDIEPMNSPSTMNPSVVPPVSNMNIEVEGVPVSQERATSCPRLNQLNNEDGAADSSGVPTGITQSLMQSSDHSDCMPDEAVMNHLHPEPAAPLDTPVSHPDDLTQPCSTSGGVPENLLNESSIPRRTTEATVQEDQRPLNRPVEASPCPSLDTWLPDPSSNPLLHSSSQLDRYMASRSLPSSHPALLVSQEYDPLQKEYDRIHGELNQVSKNHENMVSHLKSECDKEIEEMLGQIRRKYETMVKEAEASVSKKKRELERNEWKVVMNIKLAEAFRCKCIDHRPARQQVGSSLTQQPRQSVNHSTMQQRSTNLRPLVQPQIYLAGPAMPMTVVQQDQLLQNTCTGVGTELLIDQSSAKAAAAAPTPLPPLPEIARNFEAWNFTEFEAQQQLQEGLAASGVVCLSDDE